MKPLREIRSSPRKDLPSSRVVMATLVAIILVILLGMFSKVTRRDPLEPSAPTSHGSLSTASTSHALRPAPRTSSHRYAEFNYPQTAQEIVADKVTKFGRIRRELVHAMAKHFKVEVPDEVE